MTDLYSAAINEMSDYIITRLNGSAPCFELYNDFDLPANKFVVGSLANNGNEEQMSSTRAQNTSITLRFRHTGPINPVINVHYSIFEIEESGTNLREGEHLWKRIDFVDIFEPLNSEETMPLSFKKNNVVIHNYQAEVTYVVCKESECFQTEICVTNKTISTKKDRYIFNVWLEVLVDPSLLTPYTYEYYYEGNRKSIEHLFRTINCAAELHKEDGTIVTSACPQFRMYKKKLKDVEDGIDLSFETLSHNAVDALQKYSKKLEQYIDIYETSLKQRNEEYKNSLDQYKKICRKFNNGVAAIQQDSRINTAFCLMNKVFGRTSQHNNWRTFQITYIVSAIGEISNDESMDYCDIIHIPTGGGKTEAYLGLTIFTAFYERLTGHQIGTAAIVKFPLRMLSVQQMDRVIHKMIIAEEIRREHNIDGEAFSIGFYVGDSAEFPNKTLDEIESIRTNENTFGKDFVPGKLLKECPLCKGQVYLRINSQYHYIDHYCKQCGRTFKLYYTDEEIYRYLPTLIISTVDKFSTVSLNRYARGLFGCQLRECSKGHGVEPAGEGCYASISKNKRCNIIEGSNEDMDMLTVSTPRFVIQDELHLIRESFGTIDSHFESFCDQLQLKFTGKRPKHIAMTATITNCQEQINQLYCLKSNIFPGYDPYALEEMGINPFYYDEKDSDGAKLHRLIVGLKPNNRDNQFSLNLTMKYALDFVESVKTRVNDLGLGRGLEQAEIQQVVKILSKYLTYHNKKSDVRSTKQFMATVADTGDGFKAIQKALTGDNSMDEIRETMESIKLFESSDSEVIHITSATNLVSHGIDIEDWNFMEFQGIPGKTAEYIQALSRVGRRYPGLIFVWFYPTRVRDLSFYQNFTEYHSVLDHMVEPVSINRWTRLGFQETCTSIFCASILNYMAGILQRSIYRQSDVIEVFENNGDNTHQLISFINEVYHTEETCDGSSEIKSLIPKEVYKRLNTIIHSTDAEKYFFPNLLANNADRYFGTQMGMRGIQDIVAMEPFPETQEFTQRAKNDRRQN